MYNVIIKMEEDKIKTDEWNSISTNKTKCAWWGFQGWVTGKMDGCTSLQDSKPMRRDVHMDDWWRTLRGESFTVETLHLPAARSISLDGITLIYKPSLSNAKCPSQSGHPSNLSTHLHTHVHRSTGKDKIQQTCASWKHNTIYSYYL